MYWLAMFAIIMEIVFRVRDFHTKSSAQNNKSQVAPTKKIETLQRFLDYEQNDALDLSEFLESEIDLDENHYYRIKNERDNLYLTMTSTEVRNCIYRIVSINGTGNIFNSTDYFTFLNPLNTSFISQLWEIVQRKNVNYLVPAGIINLAESKLRALPEKNPTGPYSDDNVQRATTADTYTSTFSPVPSPLPVLPSELFDGDNPARFKSYDDRYIPEIINSALDLFNPKTTTTTTTTTTKKPPAQYQNGFDSNSKFDNNFVDNNNNPFDNPQPPPAPPPPPSSEWNEQKLFDENTVIEEQLPPIHHTKHRHKHHRHKPLDFEDEMALQIRRRRRKKRDSFQVPSKSSTCSRDGIKIAWKLKWSVVKTSFKNRPGSSSSFNSSLNNLKHEHFEIQGLNSTCILFKGFIGGCNRPESTWTFHIVSSKNLNFQSNY